MAKERFEQGLWVFAATEIHLNHSDHGIFDAELLVEKLKVQVPHSVIFWS